MKHRIFIAINLPQDVKKKLRSYKIKWPEIPARWTFEENLHITMLFIGEVDPEYLAEICEITKEIASKNQLFYLTLKNVSYGPLDKNPKKPPRMLWAIGEKSEKLNKLKSDIEKIETQQENNAIREFIPHITLARIKGFQFAKIDPEELPIVNEEISIRIPVSSIEVMESVLKRTGPEYAIIDSYELG